MILTNEIIRRQAQREELRQKMAAWEAKHGPVVTAPPTENRSAEIRLSQADMEQLGMDRPSGH